MKNILQTYLGQIVCNFQLPPNDLQYFLAFLDSKMIVVYSERLFFHKCYRINFPEYWLITRKRCLRPDITGKLLTWTLNLYTSKQSVMIKIIYSNGDIYNLIVRSSSVKTLH